MRKLTLLLAVAIGYVLGAKAGRQRYEQIKSAATRVKDEPHVRAAASTVAETAKEQAPVVREKVAAAASTVASAAADRSPFGANLRVTTTSCATSSTPRAPRARTTRTPRATCRNSQPSRSYQVAALASVSEATWSMTARRRPASSAAARQSSAYGVSRASGPRAASPTTSSANSSR